MRFKPLFRLLRDGRLSALLGAGAELKSFSKLTYLAAAGKAGLLNRLASGRTTLDSLADFYAARGRGREALEAWLQFGVRLRLLSLGPHGYALRAGELWSLSDQDGELTAAPFTFSLPDRFVAFQAFRR
jgi:hypothetical protein